MKTQGIWMAMILWAVVLPGCHHDDQYGACHGDECYCEGGNNCVMDCGDQEGCTQTCAALDNCDGYCSDYCSVDCRSVTSCDHQCGAFCDLTCNSVGSCRGLVGPESVATCESFGSCEITCEGSCRVNCWGCTIYCAGGGSPFDCGNGVHVCGDMPCY